MDMQTAILQDLLQKTTKSPEALADWIGQVGEARLDAIFEGRRDVANDLEEFAEFQKMLGTQYTREGPTKNLKEGWRWPVGISGTTASLWSLFEVGGGRWSPVDIATGAGVGLGIWVLSRAGRKTYDVLAYSPAKLERLARGAGANDAQVDAFIEAFRRTHVSRPAAKTAELGGRAIGAGEEGTQE